MNATPPVRLETLLEALEHASDLTDLQRLIEQFSDVLSVDHMVYHWVSGAGEQYGCGTYSPAWVRRYLDQDYVRIDPVIQGCYKLFHPVDLKRLDWSGKAARAFRLKQSNTALAIRAIQCRCAGQMASLRFLPSAIIAMIGPGPPLQKTTGAT